MNRFAIALLAGVAGVSLASAASAADLIVSEPAPAVGIVDTAGGNWDGAFIGAFAGYGWGTLADDAISTNYEGEGWQLGVTAGYNFTVSAALVAGIVADVAWADINGGDTAGVSYNTDWTGSIRGRLGIDAGAFLPYVTAGVAFANNTVTDAVGPSEDTQLHTGWTAGAGVEFAVADNVSLDLQYRYSDYGTKTYNVGGGTDLGLTSHAITAGVNFRF
ncbi:outer membrane protein [Devosia sp.]|uniref:outer membrane protein n=1 Tax=Devosia sp. TaxID=1871048 RepID=UPI001AC8F6CB|nr:outer membrane protein [Devosia sp.]MBN9311220.1 porin family protein [Devosia sp.]